MHRHQTGVGKRVTRSDRYSLTGMGGGVQRLNVSTESFLKGKTERDDLWNEDPFAPSSFTIPYFHHPNFTWPRDS